MSTVKTHRKLFENAMDGRQILKVDWSEIKADSTVLAAVAEYVPGSDRRFVGDASINIQSIGPYDGYVNVGVFIDYQRPLFIALDIVVVE
jgi:hypothetical protein